MNQKNELTETSLIKRRQLLKLPFLLLAGTSLSIITTKAHADPIKLIVDAMSTAAKYVLDVAIKIAEGVLDQLQDAFTSQDGEKVGKVGDALNTVQTEIFNQRKKLDSTPIPQSCNVENNIKRATLRRSSNKDVSYLLTEQSINKMPTATSFVYGMVTGKDHDYGRTFVNFARKYGASVGSIGSNSRTMSFNIGGLVKDGVKFATKVDKEEYMDSLDVLAGPSKTSEIRPLDLGENTTGLSKQIMHKQDSRIAVSAVASSVMLSEYRITDNQRYEPFLNEINATYYNKKWREDTSSLPSAIPASINLIYLTSTKIELYFELLLQLDKTILLKCAKLAKEMNNDR